MKWWARAVGLLAVTALVVAAVAAGSEPTAHAQSRLGARPSAIPAGIHKIRHVVIIMQENRSFDNYFGTYPHADGIPGYAGHPGKVPCIPDPGEPCVHPFHDRHDYNAGGPHGSGSASQDVDGGKMDGFIAQQEAILKHCKCVSRPADDAVGFHTGAEIPNYWTYARDFVLQDHMFQPDFSWSLPAHLYLVSLWSAHCTIMGDPRSCTSSVDNPGPPPGWGRHPTSTPPNYAWTDLTYLLFKHHVGWRYYIFRGIEPDCESDLALTCAPRTQGPQTSPVWSPLPWFTTVRKDHQLGNVESLNAFFTAVQNGTLPAVSWIMPNREVSEHPFISRISRGQTYVTGLVNTIMQSREWKSTAIFIAWDDWSGFYDNVRPPQVDGEGYGLRVPALMISPYARRGYIDHQTLSFDAYAKFIEDDFLGGQRIDPSTDGRPDPRPDVRENQRQLGNLIREFNFSQTPRKPVLLPVHPKTDFR